MCASLRSCECNPAKWSADLFYCSMEENSHQKQKRKRINPTHRWTELQVLHLLQAVADVVKETPESLEKPTAQRFYEKVQLSTPALERILWVALKSKMRHLKASYLSAVAWRSKTGTGLLANGDEASVSAYINKICPHWDLLNDIFGQRKNVNPGVIFESTQDVDTLADYPQISSSLAESTHGFDSSTFELCEESVDPPVPSTSNATPETSTPQSTEKRLKLEFEKFELEKDKENKQVELKKIEMQNQFEIKKLEIEAKKEEKLQIEKLKLESEERIKMFEIKLKCNSKEKLVLK